MIRISSSSYENFAILILTIFSFSFSLIFLPVQGATPLQSQIDQLLSSEKLENDRIGIHVVRLDDGAIVYSRNAKDLFIPASNNKLLLTAAALEILGRDFSYETRIWTTGHVLSDGALNSDIIIQGSGDPNLSGRFWPKSTSLFESCADELIKQGIRKIEGQILADDTLFDRMWTHPDWPKDQMTDWYCAQVSALAFNDNCIDLTVKPGKRRGDPLLVTMEPLTTYVDLKIKGRTGTKNSKSAVWFQRKQGTNTIMIYGKHPVGGSYFKESVTIHNPALYAAHVLREVLISKGIEVGGGAGMVNDPKFQKIKGRTLILLNSPLLKLLEITNKRSQNLFAEQILKTLGAKTKGLGTFDNGLAAVSHFLKKIDILPGTYKMVDGSGLAKQNRISPFQMVHLLRWMYESPHRMDYLKTLSVGGQDGTLSDRFLAPAFTGQVIAKTGYVRGASALSGYLIPLNGPAYTFSIFINDRNRWNSSMQKLQESICETILLMSTTE